MSPPTLTEYEEQSVAIRSILKDYHDYAALKRLVLEHPHIASAVDLAKVEELLSVKEAAYEAAVTKLHAQRKQRAPSNELDMETQEDDDEDDEADERRSGDPPDSRDEHEENERVQQDHEEEEERGSRQPRKRPRRDSGDNDDQDAHEQEREDARGRSELGQQLKDDEEMSELTELDELEQRTQQVNEEMLEEPEAHEQDELQEDPSCEQELVDVHAVIEPQHEVHDEPEDEPQEEPGSRDRPNNAPFSSGQSAQRPSSSPDASLSPSRSASAGLGDEMFTYWRSPEYNRRAPTPPRLWAKGEIRRPYSKQQTEEDVLHVAKYLLFCSRAYRGMVIDWMQFERRYPRRNNREWASWYQRRQDAVRSKKNELRTTAEINKWGRIIYTEEW